MKEVISKELCTDGDKEYQNWHTGLLTLQDATGDHARQLDHSELGSWVIPPQLHGPRGRFSAELDIPGCILVERK